MAAGLQCASPGRLTFIAEPGSRTRPGQSCQQQSNSLIPSCIHKHTHEWPPHSNHLPTATSKRDPTQKPKSHQPRGRQRTGAPCRGSQNERRSQRHLVSDRGAFLFSAVPHGLWDPSSLTKDGTHTSGSESVTFSLHNDSTTREYSIIQWILNLYF